MPNDGRKGHIGWFAVVGCVMGALLAYAALLVLQLLVAPIPPEIAGVAWSAPSIAFTGLAAWFWYGPRLLIGRTGRRA